MASGLKGYLYAQRWNILLTTQAIFTCGIVYNRYQENQAARQTTTQKPSGYHCANVWKSSSE
ncbi:hypothetical protein V7S43_001821 [Phytophthora oleae]|uniref:HIG1 domain-containing protein n=1 Tax=Phytophthora oleae TaxID=2107226 RepID=A0ABD3G3L4_9STRA